MNIASIIHESKSRYSYIYDKDVLHVRIKTGVGEVKRATVRAVDPFNWVPDENGVYVFDINTMQEIEMIHEGETRFHDVWFAEIKGIDTSRIRYSFILTDQEEIEYLYGVNTVQNVTEAPDKKHEIFNYFNFPYLNDEDIFASPQWVKDAIWYQLTVNCYSQDGEVCADRSSGNFKGLIEKLDYIKDLGCNALYLTPVFEASSWHLYDTEDYFKVSESLGGDEAFRAFMKKAHELGFKVMLDAVFNHCGYKHPFWQDVIKNGKASPYYDCFYILDDTKPVLSVPVSESGDYEDVGGYDNNFKTFAYTTAMPKLNTSNPIMREYLLKVGRYWVQEFGIDGWRLDVSNEVSHDFWRVFRKEVKGINPDVYIMGENWDDSYPWLMGDQFDAVMNYGVMNNILAFIAEPSKHVNHKINAAEYAKYNCELITKYPVGVTETMFNLVGSHDVERIMDICKFDINKVKLCYLLELTYSGSPCIYYGDEIGMRNELGESRSPMKWNEDEQCLEMKTFIKKVISLRKTHASFKNIHSEFIHTDGNVLLLKKEAEGDTVYIVVNNNDTNSEIELPAELRNRKVYDIYNERAMDLKDKMTLKAFEFLLIQ